MWKIIKSHKIILIIALVLNVVILPFGLNFTDQSITLPGGLSEVNSIIEFEDPNEQAGSISSIFVISPYRVTELEVWWANNFDKKSNVYTVSPYSSYYSREEDSLQGTIMYESSISYALIVSFNEAVNKGYDYDLSITFEGAIIEGYTEGSTTFKVGDLVTGINGIKANEDQDDFILAFNNRVSGDVFTVLRDGVNIDITLDDDSLNSMTKVYRKYTYDEEKTTPSFTVNFQNVGGPSGGLLQTLSIYNALIDDDITSGYKISGTGTIDVNGNVGAIGGIKQKIYTADKNDVDVFFCPESNYSDALEAYNTLSSARQEKMKLVSVSTFSDATNFLESLGE